MTLTVCSMGFGARTGTAGIVTMGFGTGGVVPPPVVTTTNTPGFIRRIVPLGRDRGESDEEKLARRIREGTIVLPQPIATPTAPNDARALARTAEYVRESAGLAIALQRLRGEREALLARTAELEAMQIARQSAKVAAELLRKRQALQMQAIQEAMVLEQMEVLDVAYCVAVVLRLQ